MGDPSLAEQWIKHASRLVELGRWADAAGALERLIEEDQYNLEARALLIQVKS